MELWTERKRGGQEAGTCAGWWTNQESSKDIWTKQIRAEAGAG